MVTPRRELPVETGRVTHSPHPHRPLVALRLLGSGGLQIRLRALPCIWPPGRCEHHGQRAPLWAESRAPQGPQLSHHVAQNAVCTGASLLPESQKCLNQNLETVMQSEVSQKEKNKYRILTHIRGI